MSDMGYDTFEGRRVNGKTIKVKAGEFATDETKHHGAEFYVLTRVVLDDIQHPNKDDQLIRRQVAAPQQSWVIPQLTAARMIDQIEPPKLAGTTREAMVPDDPTLDLSIGVDGSVTFTDTFSGESYTAPPDDETQAGRTVIDGVTVDTESGEILADTDGGRDPAPTGAVGASEGRPDAGDPSGVSESPVTGVPQSHPGVRRSTPTQRVNLSKQIAALDEVLTNQFLAWCKTRLAPINPSQMSFAEANAALTYVGAVRDVEQ